jgi:hypothetical protein
LRETPIPTAGLQMEYDGAPGGVHVVEATLMTVAD